MQVWCCWQVKLCDPHLSALEVRFSRRCAIQIDVYLYLYLSRLQRVNLEKHCVTDRTLKAFETWLKKGARGADYVFPSEMLVQMNVIVDFKNQHRYNEDEFLDKIQGDMRSSLMERVSVPRRTVAYY